MGSLDNRNDAIDLPIIDISTFDKATGKAMLDASIKYGFLYIATPSTTFTPQLIDAQFALSEKVFALPTPQKSEYQIDENNKGWTGMHNEILDPKHQKRGDWKEAFNVGEFIDNKPNQPLPSVLSTAEPQLFDFESRCRSTCARILDLLALGLEVEGEDAERFFSVRHTKPSGSTTRLLHYPSVPDSVPMEAEVDIRAGAHSDYGSCTLLFQRAGQPGLEIRTPYDTWAPVAVIPPSYESVSTTTPPILVNIGDLLSYWTNGLLKSTVHRVIFPAGEKRDRYSIAFFCHPANDEKLVPVPSRMVRDTKLDKGAEVGYGGGATKKRAMTAKEHLMNRLEATYGFRKAVETV
jgi:isopenicillin N synthase-like dioxygenase